MRPRPSCHVEAQPPAGIRCARRCPTSRSTATVPQSGPPAAPGTVGYGRLSINTQRRTAPMRSARSAQPW
ncbi:hypothetical protein SXIM_23060 [Streptomyces xiamenensis]|uniref:Uncharacterized protein n=1 Tax=Streptomyces xiamenensis TaxID=408015 RepID=A0A0F7FV13_9ACTN|nr:hypothetical protein SXIM_23060 [Streptomyces xiamenensis]